LEKTDPPSFQRFSSSPPPPFSLGLNFPLVTLESILPALHFGSIVPSPSTNVRYGVLAFWRIYRIWIITVFPLPRSLPEETLLKRSHPLCSIILCNNLSPLTLSFPHPYSVNMPPWRIYKSPQRKPCFQTNVGICFLFLFYVKQTKNPSLFTAVFSLELLFFATPVFSNTYAFSLVFFFA